ncbi:hypothetical protein HPB51_018518 [Rhipicephalus microplus]|uniref:Uncharacterized protein n=1 Tax=Rhipicephalus microplus TaxID=6941 RepID=A0A9J6EIC1_RHIMP|nr:hypothetical protein HPB51_018518 [Rhipicephalus microplus]
MASFTVLQPHRGFPDCRGAIFESVRPKGGLDLKRVSRIRLAQALEKAAILSPEETLEDIVCPNITQNIVVVSTPTSSNVGAYTAASDDTCKSVIRGLDVDIDERQLAAMIVNQRHPKAMQVHRVKETTTVIVLFSGIKETQAAPPKEYRVTDWDEIGKRRKADETEYATLEELFSRHAEDELLATKTVQTDLQGLDYPVYEGRPLDEIGSAFTNLEIEEQHAIATPFNLPEAFGDSASRAICIGGDMRIVNSQSCKIFGSCLCEPHVQLGIVFYLKWLSRLVSIVVSLDLNAAESGVQHKPQTRTTTSLTSEATTDKEACGC